MRSVIKAAYKKLPLKRYIFSFIKKFWSPSKKVYKHLYFTGNITIPVDDLNSFKVRHYGYSVENDLFWSGINGDWEHHSLKSWIKLVTRSTVIFDIGANTGVYSLIAKSVNKKAIVYAFEPVERVYDKLVFNNQLNNFDIHCIKKALSDSTGKGAYI